MGPKTAGIFEDVFVERGRTDQVPFHDLGKI